MYFPSGTVHKNQPDNAGDIGSIPSPGRFHMPQSNEACVRQLLNPSSRACEPQLPSPPVAPDGHEFESTPGVGDGQGGLACCGPWGRKLN